MPNYCDYEMKIKGTKKNCKEWLSRMNDYEKENHFWRIFDADIVDENGNNVVEIFKKVEILNFHPTQLIGRNEDGMIILKPRNIIYMHTHKEIK